MYLPDGEYGGPGPLLLQVTDEVGSAMAEAAPAEVAITSSYRVEQARVANVIAPMPADVRDGGSAGAADRSDQAPPLVLSAHFDGHGRVGPTLYPGAVDNASGVAVVVAAARALADQRPAAGRPVWVVLFNGEEQGLYGSRAFVERYREELSGAHVINVDMVAHSADRPVEVAGADGGRELGAHLAEALRREGLSVTTTSAGGSDHASFAGTAAAVSLIQAPYPQMPLPEDTAARVDAAVLERTTAVLRYTRWLSPALGNAFFATGIRRRPA